MLPPLLSRTSSSAAGSMVPSPIDRSRNGTPTPGHPYPYPSLGVKKATLTSKKNWWLVEMDEEEEAMPGLESEERDGLLPTPTSAHAHEPPHAISQPYADIDPGSPSPSPSPPSSPHVFHPPPGAHPSALFSFPTPTAYAAPPGALAALAPCASGSTSVLFSAVVKTPEVVQLEVNGELHTNAADVAAQFRAELRVYTRVGRHRNLCAFLGCLDGVGMVLECIDGVPMLDVVRARPPPDDAMQVDLHNQLLDGLAHVHSAGLSHGDLSLLNVFVTRGGTLKLLDFGRSVDADSVLVPPDAPPPGDDPTADGGYRPLAVARMDSGGSSTTSTSASASASSTYRAYTLGGHKRRRTGPPRVEQIHPGTRPFAAPEVLRGECADARLADAYSFGVVLVCLAHGALVDADPEAQMRDELPAHFVEGVPSTSPLRERITWYVQRWDRRRRVSSEDLIAVKRWWDDED